MEQFHQMIQEANKYFTIADHLAYVTYPVVKEIKLTLTIAQNLYNAMTKVIDAIILYERFYKRISPVPDEFETKLDVLRNCLRRYNINQDYIRTYRELKMILKSHTNSPVEFVKNNKLIICSDSYTEINTLDIERLKKYVIDVRNFIEETRKIR